MSDLSLLTSPQWPYVFLPIILGLVVSALWVVPTIAWQWVGKGKGASSIRHLGWLSSPWLVLYPLSLVVGSITDGPLGTPMTFAAIGLIPLTPIMTFICAIIGVVVLKKQRTIAIAVGLGNVLISLCCAFGQLVVYAVSHGA